jgi:predicted dehydrogenase
MADKIKVGILGIGRAGYGMHTAEIDRFPDLFEIVAAADIDPAHCKAMAEKCGCRTYGSIDELLADDEVELVSVATRSPDHVNHAIQCLEAGKYVFQEKPIALTYADALRLAEADKKFPGKLYLRHNRRFEPEYQHIREIMAEGLLGDVYEIKLRRNNYQRRNDWQTIIECGGGQLNNWGPHIIDHGLRLLESPLKELWSDLKKVAAVGNAEDHLKIIMKGENDRIIDLEISGGSAISEPQYLIHGSRGALKCEGNQITMKYLDPEVELMDIAADPTSPPIDNSFGNPEQLVWIEKTFDSAPATGCDTYVIWKHMYDAIREGVPFPIKMEEALEVVKVTEQVKKNSQFAL